VAIVTLDRATLAARKRAYAYEPRLVKAITALLRSEMRLGAARVKALDTLHLTDGEVFPHAPDTRRVLLILEAVAESVAGPLLEAASSEQKADPNGLAVSASLYGPDRFTEQKSVTAAVNPEPSPEDLLRVSFTASNPLVRRLLDEFGLQITQVTDGERRRIVEAARTAYAEGLSIPNAAAAIMESVAATEVRATMIARTMLVGAANGASLAAVRMAGAASTKTWLSTSDGRTRPDHIEANGQTVPIDKPFQIGGYAMQYPGDPSGPPDETCNCRCTLVYSDSATGPEGINSAPPIPALAAAGGTLSAMSDPHSDAALLPPNHDYIGRGGPCVMCGMMPDAPAHSLSGMAADRDVAALDGTRWQAVLALEGVPTDDGRVFAIGALDWREPPLTLYGQFENAEGHDDAPIIGRIDSITRVSRPDGTAVIMGAGVFDSGDAGQMATRLVGDRTLNGISIDFTIHEAEIVDGPIGPDQEPGSGTLAISSATMLAATVLGMAAFGEAVIAITADAGKATLTVPITMAMLTRDGVSADVEAAAAALDRATLPDRITAAAGLIDRHVITEAEARAMIGLDGDAPDVTVAPPQSDAVAALAASLDGRFEPLVAALERVANQPPPQLPAITLTLPAEPARRIIRDEKTREIIGSEPVEANA
jgi:hypothetical protein